MRPGWRAAALLAVGVACLPAPTRADEPRVLAIGDIHGSLDGLTEILRETGLADADDRWSGGRTLLVQTGDFTDRGDDVRAVMELLMELQKGARAAGGEVKVLLGNHELLNLMRHDADVAINPRIYASFADAGSEAKRRRALDAWKGWRRSREKLEESGELGPPTPATDEEWLARHPLGFVEYHEALSARGRYGAWIRTLPVVYRVGETIFLHGGLSESFAALSLERINELHREEIEALDQTIARLERKGIIPPWFTWTEIADELRARGEAKVKRQAALIEEASQRLDRFLAVTGSANSPLWYRGFARPPQGLADDELATLRDTLVEAYGAHNFVVAHSPFNGKEIAVRLDAFFLIDTGMLTSVYSGRPSALEISGDGIAAIYPGQREQLLTAARPSVDATHRPTRALATRPAATAASGPRFVLASAAAQEPSGNDTPAYVRPERRWLDSAGEPLPFADPAEVERFLESATVVSSRPVGVGKTGAQLLELEHGGVRARGIFHDIHDQRDATSGAGPTRMSRGTTMLRFRDSYSGQAAAYRLALLMGMDNVPPVVVREVEGVKGSVAFWIEGATNLTDWQGEHGRQPQNPHYQHQIWDMRVWDALINNKDRNTGNIVWTPDWSLWLVDHTRTFAQDPVLYREDFIQRCSRELRAKIEGLDEKEAIAALKPHLSVFEVKAMFKRRKRLLRYLDDRIDKLGEERVHFDYGDPVGQITIRESRAGST